MERKTYKFTELKFDHDGEGTFEAVFATLDAIDHDGDTYDPGAIGQQDVVISQWNHGSWNGGTAALPVGVGKVFERGNKAIVQGEFNMDSPDGKAHHHTLKYLHEKGRNVEWSFALPDMDTRLETIDDVTVRVITRVAIPEVSPVLLGAGVGTELLSIKDRGTNMVDTNEIDLAVARQFGKAARAKIDKDMGIDPNETTSMKFATQLDEAVEAVESVIGRAKEIRNLREDKGTDENMTKRNTRRLKDLKGAMVDAIEAVDEILDNPNDELNELAASFTEEQNGT